MSAPFMTFDSDDPMSMYRAAMMGRGSGASQRFDEYYRCYPVAMMPGPERESIDHGGKVFLPASALERLTRLHITYPMLFELFNGAKERSTHAGVLEFTAEEGKIYLPFWLMQTLLLEAGDLIQVKSTDLPPGTFIKLQPQSPSFLDITDPKAVLENAFRNFSCLTVGDIFSFDYNDTVYEIAVLEVKPDIKANAICTMETDLSVDFAEPVGYQEMLKAQAAAKPAASHAKPQGGKIHTQGTMAQAINYASMAPSSDVPAHGSRAISSNFQGEGNRLGGRRGGPSVPINAGSDEIKLPSAVPRANAANTPKPLRLPHGKLFFGYEFKPPPKHGEHDEQQPQKTHFQGRSQNLRGKVVEAASDDAAKASGSTESKNKGRTLRDS
ncbi:MAG: ubiquitin fusion degradation protein [Chrysothrix sp. TS-e1954]|nr:MAG: ubiquitin fusion degradation protein [Chrysothrix sp. TS-e1954]